MITCRCTIIVHSDVLHDVCLFQEYWLLISNGETNFIVAL